MQWFTCINWFTMTEWFVDAFCDIYYSFVVAACHYSCTVCDVYLKLSHLTKDISLVLEVLLCCDIVSDIWLLSSVTVMVAVVLTVRRASSASRCWSHWRLEVELSSAPSTSRVPSSLTCLTMLAILQLEICCSVFTADKCHCNHSSNNNNNNNQMMENINNNHDNLCL